MLTEHVGECIIQLLSQLRIMKEEKNKKNNTRNKENNTRKTKYQDLDQLRAGSQEHCLNCLN